jgi:GxxExxY protein
MENDLIYKQEVYEIIGAAMEVHKELGNGFLEAVYHEALEKEFRNRNIPFESQKQFDIYYKDEILDKKYIADMICYGNIIIELKAVDKLSDEHYSQVINYLKASKLILGILINFGSKSPEFKRVIYK